MKIHNAKAIFVLLALTMPVAAQAAFQTGTGEADVLIGADNDNVDNPLIQPPGTEANQSLNNTDIQEGGGGNDVLIGLLGNDGQHGGPGADITIGGTEQGVTPNSDVIFGDQGNDINIWAPGDGSDAFIGGRGHRDAMIFGVIDRDADNVPTLTSVGGPHSETGVPTADLSGSPGFCTVEKVEDPDLGFDSPFDSPFDGSNLHLLGGKTLV
jgi:Ca2+-binding RTX toxin-like protein